MPSCQCFARRVKHYFCLPEIWIPPLISTVHGVVFAFCVGARPAHRYAPASSITPEVPMPIQHFAAPPHVKAPPLSFATRVGDLLFVSGIPGFDANGALPDGFEAQFANVVVNIKRVLD